VAVVEWFDRLGGGVADEYLCVTLAFAGGDARTLQFAAHGARHRALIEAARPADTAGEPSTS
jgi:hypothetical protein